MCNDLIVACIWTIQTYIQHAGYHESVVFMAVVACYSTALMMLVCLDPLPQGRAALQDSPLTQLQTRPASRCRVLSVNQ
ncbi:TPA: hypothetical protein ACH3X3_004824 [Trebouxia sp. C0006]